MLENLPRRPCRTVPEPLWEGYLEPPRRFRKLEHSQKSTSGPTLGTMSGRAFRWPGSSYRKPL